MPISELLKSSRARLRPGPAPSAMSRQNCLVVTDLSVDYGYGPVVDGMSLEVDRGEILAVVGANGAGKTSTLRGIAAEFNNRARGNPHRLAAYWRGCRSRGHYLCRGC